MKKSVGFLFGGLVLFIIAGLSTFQIYEQQKVAAISSFEECKKAGYQISESYPAQCAIPNGKSFTQKLTPEEQVRISPPQ